MSNSSEQFMNVRESKGLKPILRMVDNINLPAHERFVASESFTRENNFCLGIRFNENFLDKVEENVAAATLVFHALDKSSLDAQIHKEIGQEREEISLAHFFDLLKKQSKGEEQEGPLFVNINGYNIAYIRDKSKTLWAVYARWDSDCCEWNINALSLEDVIEWDGGCQIISRDC